MLESNQKQVRVKYVIPGRAKREPGIQKRGIPVWIPGLVLRTIPE